MKKVVAALPEISSRSKGPKDKFKPHVKTRSFSSFSQVNKPVKSKGGDEIS